MRTDCTERYPAVRRPTHKYRYYGLMADKPKQSEAENAVEKAVEDPQIPKIYANSFGVGLTNADIFVVFQRFGQRPVAIVNLSYTLAKTLAQRLGTLVAEFETDIAQQTILTTDRIDEAVKKRDAAKTAESKDEVH